MHAYYKNLKHCRTTQVSENNQPYQPEHTAQKASIFYIRCTSFQKVFLRL